MIFTTQRSELLEAVQNLSRIVTKTSQPVLEGILISAEKGKITLVSYNLEMSMKKEICYLRKSVYKRDENMHDKMPKKRKHWFIRKLS